MCGMHQRKQGTEVTEVRRQGAVCMSTMHVWERGQTHLDVRVRLLSVEAPPAPEYHERDARDEGDGEDGEEDDRAVADLRHARRVCRQRRHGRRCCRGRQPGCGDSLPTGDLHAYRRSAGERSNASVATWRLYRRCVARCSRLDKTRVPGSPACRGPETAGDGRRAWYGSDAAGWHRG